MSTFEAKLLETIGSFLNEWGRGSEDKSRSEEGISRHNMQYVHPVTLQRPEHFAFSLHLVSLTNAVARYG